jgi:hypothetical protein
MKYNVKYVLNSFILHMSKVSTVTDMLTTLVCGGWDVYHHVAPCCSRNTLWETHGEPVEWGRDWLFLVVEFIVHSISYTLFQSTNTQT